MSYEQITMKFPPILARGGCDATRAVTYLLAKDLEQISHEKGFSLVSRWHTSVSRVWEGHRQPGKASGLLNGCGDGAGGVPGAQTSDCNIHKTRTCDERECFSSSLFPGCLCRPPWRIALELDHVLRWDYRRAGKKNCGVNMRGFCELESRGALPLASAKRSPTTHLFYSTCGGQSFLPLFLLSPCRFRSLPPRQSPVGLQRLNVKKGSAGDIAALCAGQVSTHDCCIPWTKVDSAIPTGAEMFTLGVDITNISSQRPAFPWGVSWGYSSTLDSNMKGGKIM